MGCGESKHVLIATGNTIFRRKKSGKEPALEDPTVHQKDPTAEKASKSTDTAVEHRAEDVANRRQDDVASTVVETREVKNDVASTVVEAGDDPTVHQKDATVEKASESAATAVELDPAHEHRAEDVANLHQNDVASTVVETREVKNDDEVNVVSNETLNNVISEDNQDQEVSGKSDHDTPPRGSSADPTVDDSKPDDHDDQKIDIEGAEKSEAGQEFLNEPDQPKPDQEDQTDAEKSEKAEENVEKEELEVSIPSEEENNNVTPNPEEKHVVDSPTKELKTV